MAPTKEVAWWATTDPGILLHLLISKASDRKLRLFAVACFRHWPNLPEDERYLRAIRALERRAEGTATQAEVDQAGRDAGEVLRELREAVQNELTEARRFVAFTLSRGLLSSTAVYVAHGAVERTRLAFDLGAGRAWLTTSRQCDLIREVFGNPFHPPTIDPAWLAWNASVVARMARDIYADHAVDRLPLLADALEDAGCTDAELLGHLRGPGPHVPGCWVVDLLLGKK
jgi:hypothetical protein